MLKRTPTGSKPGKNRNMTLVKESDLNIDSGKRRAPNERLFGRSSSKPSTHTKDRKVVGAARIQRAGVDRKGGRSGDRPPNLGRAYKYRAASKRYPAFRGLKRLPPRIEDVESARFVTAPEFLSRIDQDTPTKVQQAGILYEHKIVKTLERIYGKDYVIPWAWIEYVTTRCNVRYCQPDAIIIFEKYILIVEIKLSHSRAGKAKLKSIYKQVAEKLWPELPIKLVQIFKNYRKAALKKIVSIYELDSLASDEYYECQYGG